ncbi:relaxase/mobilization nuclease domain-containing protein [Pantoea vagans]|uniref:relaxase/mobilization nuclease domain-containing protein n=1 Tax=Pantoea vagans TaxID=470934 RepID=UPI0023B160AE|nr:relaxase/mobilization nuclease domain-containing protein [Pantoea vagans]MDE8558834.1 relaxase/mobilization nuclease domain-containing protein [Pantoea vagans]MDE8578839.1 relaxase/mobilization nuclease domain-containing protein [Pantoea vagans]
MKGMNKIKRGKNFRGVVSYALSPAPHHSTAPLVIGGNLVGITVDELTAEFAKTQNLREDVEKPVWHNSLRLPKDESLSKEQWKLIADDYMTRMGFSDTHLRCYVLHDDENGQHIHIIASRINVLLDGQLYLGRNENLKSTCVIQDLEQEHNLTRTVGPSPEKRSQKQKKLSRNETMMQDRTGEKAPKIVIQEAIDAVLTFFDEITIEDFIGELQKQNISATANIASTGKMNGFSFEHKGLAFKASQLGKAYSWSNLSKRVIVAHQTEAITPVSIAINENVSTPIEVHPTATPSCLMAKSSEHTRSRWLLWIPYLSEFLGSMKAIGLSVLKPARKACLIKKIMDENPNPLGSSKVDSQDSVRKPHFKPL